MDEPKAKKLDILSDDRISLLPEPILHRILCLISQKEAIRTCVLSKAWRYLACTRPKIKFFENDDSLDSPAFMERILQGYHDRNLRLDTFTLWLSKGYVDREGVDIASLLNKWIPIIIHDMRVKKFDLSMNSRPQLFELPSLILESDSIQNLSLVRCMLNSSTVEVRVDLKRLRTLYLFHVCIPEQVLENILSTCPLIRNVSLLYCKGFTRIKLLKKNSTNLKRFSFCHSNSNPDVSIEFRDSVQTLKTIKIERRNKPLEFARLTQLSLTRVKLSSSESFSCNLHRLEELKLDRCSGIKEFKLSSRSMKCLSIHNISKPFSVTVDAPRIVSFKYEGILPQSISFATTPSDDHLWKSQIILGFYSLPRHWFGELYGLLKALSQSEISLELDRIEVRRFWSQDVFGGVYDVPIDRIVVISEEAKQLPVAVEHLTINRSDRNIHAASSAFFFIDWLFHVFRPSYMYMGTSMLNDSHNEHLDIAELLFKHRETPHSCYIWKRVLEGVDVQVLYQNQCQWQIIEHTSFTELSKNAAESKELQLRFHLKWRD